MCNRLFLPRFRFEVRKIVKVYAIDLPAAILEDQGGPPTWWLQSGSILSSVIVPGTF